MCRNMGDTGYMMHYADTKPDAQQRCPLLSETSCAFCILRLAQSSWYPPCILTWYQLLGSPLIRASFCPSSDMLSTDACRRTYISSSNPTHNKAALSMTNRSASEDEKGRGGEIVTIALVPAGAGFSSNSWPMPLCCLPRIFSRSCPVSLA